MKEKDTLSPRQRRFVAALLVCKTSKEAALSCGVTERCGRRWLASPVVKAALSDALADALGVAARAAVAAMTDALKTLEAIHSDASKPAGSRVSAARAILETGPRLWEALDLAERVAALEKKLEVKGE